MPRTLLLLRFLVLIAFASGCATIIPKEIEFTKTGERLIRVCVLNDAFYPVPEDIIQGTLNGVFQEYKIFTNIVFLREPTRIFYEDITAQPLEKYAAKIWHSCQNILGIKIVFSNIALTVSHFPSVNNENALPDEIQAGISSERWGVILLLIATEQWQFFDLGENRALATALKHEVGHCFGLKHVSNDQSFMYAPSVQSFGQWTREIVVDIKKNYYKTWYRP